MTKKRMDALYQALAGVLPIDCYEEIVGRKVPTVYTRAVLLLDDMKRAAAKELANVTWAIVCPHKCMPRIRASHEELGIAEYTKVCTLDSNWLCSQKEQCK